MAANDDKLLSGSAAALILCTSHRTLEHPKSTVRKALEELGAVVHIGRLVRYRESAVYALVQRGAPTVRSGRIKPKKRASDAATPPASPRPHRRKAGEQPEAA